jgi:DNA invertase Pin-like site-specific DNA recombinase
MLGAIAQFETEIRPGRQMDGIQKAKERGVHFGRKKNLTQLSQLKGVAGLEGA